MKTQKPTKWTKKELAALRSTLNSFLVLCRERYGRHPEFAESFAARLDEKRKEIVVAVYDIRGVQIDFAVPIWSALAYLRDGSAVLKTKESLPPRYVVEWKDKHTQVAMRYEFGETDPRSLL